VDATQHEGRSEAAVTRRRHRERHLGGREGLQSAPQSRQLRLFDTGAGAAGIEKASVGIIVGEQQGAKIGPASFGIGPADHQKLLAVEALDLEPDAAIARRVR